MILSGATIQKRHIIRPHLPRTEMRLPDGSRISFGESFAGAPHAEGWMIYPLFWAVFGVVSPFIRSSN